MNRLFSAILSIFFVVGASSIVCADGHSEIKLAQATSMESEMKAFKALMDKLPDTTKEKSEEIEVKSEKMVEEKVLDIDTVEESDVFEEIEKIEVMDEMEEVKEVEEMADEVISDMNAAVEKVSEMDSTLDSKDSEMEEDIEQVKEIEEILDTVEDVEMMEEEASKQKNEIEQIVEENEPQDGYDFYKKMEKDVIKSVSQNDFEIEEVIMEGSESLAEKEAVNNVMEIEENVLESDNVPDLDVKQAEELTETFQDIIEEPQAVEQFAAEIGEDILELKPSAEEIDDFTEAMLEEVDDDFDD